MKKIPVSTVSFKGNEIKYVNECLEDRWISGSGKFIDLFEKKFAKYVDSKYAISVSSGTSALHLALLALGISNTDEVIVPSVTYIATANAVKYCNATPVFCDIDPFNWTICAKSLSQKITEKTKAIIPVHLFGHPANMDELKDIARNYNLYLIEDAAEAIGSTYKNKPVGALGDIGIFSFFGNKIITTGEGGMVTTNNEKLAKKIRTLKTQGMDENRRYWFPVIGYNYRMTNIQAAIGLAQLENIELFLHKRKEILKYYKDKLKDCSLLFQKEESWAKSACWLTSIVLPETCDRDAIIQQLDLKNIETRPFFHPIHLLPPYLGKNTPVKIPVSENLALRGISLPTSSEITTEQLDYICNNIMELL